MKETNATAAVQTIGWIFTVFEPHIYEETEVKKPGYLNDKLKKQLLNLENNTSECFPAEKIAKLTETISDFLTVSEKIQNAESYEKYFYQHFRLKVKKRKKAKKIWQTANELLLSGKLTNN